MAESIRERYDRWELENLLLRHSGLRILPSSDDVVILAGTLSFHLRGPRYEAIEDAYAVELRVPPEFPAALPSAKETGGRIPADYHKLEGGLLCLGAPMELRMQLRLSPRLLTFVNRFVVPYLFGYSYFARHGETPFGELGHGAEGILQHLAELFGAPAAPGVERFILLASVRRREADERPCPCGSGRRLGRCHHRTVNQLRDRLGRPWWRAEYGRVSEHLASMRSASPEVKIRGDNSHTEKDRPWGYRPA